MVDESDSASGSDRRDEPANVGTGETARGREGRDEGNSPDAKALTAQSPRPTIKPAAARAFLLLFLQLQTLES